MDFTETPSIPADLLKMQEVGYERLEALVQGQSEVLEMISKGASLSAILESIVHWVELQSTDSLFATILLLDENGERLLYGAAPSLPDEYNKAIHGVIIGPQVGSCGTAAYLRETVIVEDIETDLRWKDYKHLAQRFNLKACWSTPLLNKHGRVLGTFAIYYQEPKTPTYDDLQLIRLVTRTAVIAIEHKQAEEERSHLLELERRVISEEKHLRHEQEKLLSRIEYNGKRFRSMIEQAPVAMGVLRGPDFIIETANNALLNIWGKDASVIGLTLIEGLPEIANQPFPELLRNVVNTGEAYYGYAAPANLLRGGKMETCYFNFVYAPYYEDGILAGVQVVANEVTAQILAKKELEESERRFRNLVGEAPVATAIYTGSNMIISLANEAMLKVWGKDAAVIGNPLREGLPELEGQPFLQLLDDVFTTGVPYSAQEDLAELVVDGRLQPFYFNFTYHPLRDAKGNVYAILNMAVDVTESVTARKKVQEQEERYRSLATELETRVKERTRDLQRANESLERSNAELAQYAYVASHDLQEPLRKIRVFSSMLNKKVALDKEGADLLARVMSSSDRMSQLINDLLEFSRLLNAGKAVQPVNLNEVLQNVLVDFELSIKEKNASIRLDRLPQLEAVPLQMNQLFNNLLSNALKFSKKNLPLQVTIRSRILSNEEVIEYSLQPAKKYFEIIFSDNGIGFDPKFAEQIFEVFKRLHNRQVYPGSGIGLALCRKIIENHQGHLFAHSTEGEGTEFHIVLPERQGGH